MKDAARTWRELLGDVDRKAAAALVYAAAALSATEYWLLPSVAGRTGLPRLFPGAPPDLASGLVWAAGAVLLFMALPFAWVRLRGEKAASIGWSTAGFRKHLVVYGALMLVMAPAVVWASRRPDFAAVYPFVPSARLSLNCFLVWEAAYVLQFLALESFFRGFLLFTLERRFGANAVFVSVVPYAMIHFHKPPAECFGAIVAGVVLGFLALRFRSFLGGALLHAGVAVLMDVLSVRRSGLF